jgi:flagellar motility protein MotE (MotC chaperone)
MRRRWDPARLPRLRLLPALLGALALLLGVKLIGAGAAAVEAILAVRLDLVAPARATGGAPASPPAAAAPAATPPAPAARPAAGSAAGPAAGAPSPAQAPGAAAECTVPPAAAAERALLESLRARRQELDRRDQAAAEREMLIAAAERRLAERVDSLAALQARLEAAETARTDREEAGWRQLVKLYEGMRPRDAATIFDELEMPVLVQILHRMGERKAAPVLGAMRPDRARLLTAELARHRAPPPTQ